MQNVNDKCRTPGVKPLPFLSSEAPTSRQPWPTSPPFCRSAPTPSPPSLFPAVSQASPSPYIRLNACDGFGLELDDDSGFAVSPLTGDHDLEALYELPSDLFLHRTTLALHNLQGDLWVFSFLIRKFRFCVLLIFFVKLYCWLNRALKTIQLISGIKIFFFQKIHIWAPFFC